MVALFWEHNFRTLPFEILGLRGLAERGFSVIVFGGHAKTWLPDQDIGSGAARLGTEGIYHELGVSIVGFLGWLRVDLAKPLGGGPLMGGVGIYSPF